MRLCCSYDYHTNRPTIQLSIVYLKADGFVESDYCLSIWPFVVAILQNWSLYVVAILPNWSPYVVAILPNWSPYVVAILPNWSPYVDAILPNWSPYVVRSRTG